MFSSTTVTTTSPKPLLLLHFHSCVTTLVHAYKTVHNKSILRKRGAGSRVASKRSEKLKLLVVQRNSNPPPFVYTASNTLAVNSLVHFEADQRRLGGVVRLEKGVTGSFRYSPHRKGCDRFFPLFPQNLQCSRVDKTAQSRAKNVCVSTTFKNAPELAENF